ncbi:unnamed protein product, partial [Mesorhabditis belari]|uniref:Carboxypeptidase n=1 Tax=Mesorhabditis belari TaxID=2138241 RepID=A0AAF3EUF1_9BILA
MPSYDLPAIIITIIVIIWLLWQCWKKPKLEESHASMSRQSWKTDITQQSPVSGSIACPSTITAISPLHRTSSSTSGEIKTGRAKSVAETRKLFDKSSSDDGRKSVHSDSYPVKNDQPFVAAARTNSVQYDPNQQPPRSRSEGKKDHLHYWFVESQSNPKNDPLILWLNGGPGCSSLLGLLQENGPFLINADGKALHLNAHSWNANASVLYLEAPAGVGFSYTDAPDERLDDDITATKNWEALVQFFNEFPRFKSNDFYITGESYAGKYIPTLVDEILNRTPEFKMKLKGMAIGNGLMADALVDATLPIFLNQHLMYDEKEWNAHVKKCCQGNVALCQQEQSAICNAEWQEFIYQAWDSPISPYNMYQKCKPSQDRFLFDLQYRFREKRNFDKFLERHAKSKAPACDLDAQAETYLNKPTVRKALGIPANVQSFNECNTNVLLGYDQSKYPSVHDQIDRALKRGVKTMLYYGDVDMACNVMHGQQFSEEFIKDPENTFKWYFVDRVAGGKWMQEGNFRFVSVRGSGHMVPKDNPIVAKHIIDRFINWAPLDSADE